MNGYVVTRPYTNSNVGSNLSSLAGAVYVARALGRDLVVDWRGMSQLRDSQLNYFSEFFRQPAELAGVPVHYAPLGDADYAETSPDATWLEPGYAFLAAADPPPDLPRFVVLRSYHGLDRVHPGPESERFRLLREIYGRVGPVEVIQDRLDHWWRDHVHASFVVAVNVRTGNGQWFGRGGQYAARVDISLFADGQRFLRLLERACRARAASLPKALRDDFQIFYATDSGDMSELLARLPNSVTRRTVFPPPNTGDQYAFGDDSYTDRDGVADTITDMFLLARCDALVYNTSLFNQYGRVTTAYYSGNQVHFETLLLRKRLRHVVARSRRLLAGRRP